MIGMIPLSGIVTLDFTILFDFKQQPVARRRPLLDTIIETRVVRLLPIILAARCITVGDSVDELQKAEAKIKWPRLTRNRCGNFSLYLGTQSAPIYILQFLGRDQTAWTQ